MYVGKSIETITLRFEIIITRVKNFLTKSVENIKNGKVNADLTKEAE